MVRDECPSSGQAPGWASRGVQQAIEWSVCKRLDGLCITRAVPAVDQAQRKPFTRASPADALGQTDKAHDG